MLVRRPTHLLVGLALIASPFLRAQTTYLIDFNGVADAGGYPGGESAWNRYSGPGDVTGLLSDTGGSSSGSISISQTGMNNSTNTGTAIFDNPDGGPAWVTDSTELALTGAASDYFFTSTSSTSSFTVTLAGFNIGDIVSLDLWASRNSSTNGIGFYSYSLDNGSTWHGFQVLNKDGSPATANGWNTHNTLTQSYHASNDGNIAARYMHGGELVLIDEMILIRGQDPQASHWTPLNAIRVQVIPEPATVAMITALFTLGAVVIFRRRQR